MWTPNVFRAISGTETQWFWCSVSTWQGPSDFKNRMSSECPFHQLLQVFPCTCAEVEGNASSSQIGCHMVCCYLHHERVTKGVTVGTTHVSPQHWQAYSWRNSSHRNVSRLFFSRRTLPVVMEMWSDGPSEAPPDFIYGYCPVSQLCQLPWLSSDAHCCVQWKRLRTLNGISRPVIEIDHRFQQLSH